MFGKGCFSAFLLVSCLLTPAKLHAGEPADRPLLHLEAGAGYAFKLSAKDRPPGDYRGGGLSSGFKLFLSPNATVGYGFETGYFNVSALSGELLKAKINAVPLLWLIRFDMGSLDFQLGVGYYYILARSYIDSNRVAADEFDLGYSIGAGYPLGGAGRWKWGIEAQWSNIAELQISMLRINVRLSHF
ncbi:MAG: hypothetical protein NDJ90_00990 [Oligoflexia bacterium]|nr:hypothetical protein [Oligoflexia bacterium]